MPLASHRSSHELKGAILQFCAPAALQACKELEESAKAGNLAHGGQLYATLEQEVLRLLAALHQVRRQRNGRMNTLTTSDHLLVIDPCPDTQARIAEQLEGRGFSVVAASDPTTALATIDMAAPDIVITDLFLPEAAGLTLVKELKARHERCPVIVMAKDAPEPMIIQALRIGAADYLHKPIAEEELAHALQRARNLLPGDLADIPGLCRSEYRLTVDSDPTHIPGMISWLIKTTTSTLPPIRRLHLRGALQELLFNAIEHGNLEIVYQEKQEALGGGPV